MKNALSFVPTIRPNLRRLRIPFLSLTPFAHRYPSQTLLRLKIYQKLFFTHMHNWLSLYICRKNTYQSAVIRSISKCLAPKFASLFTASEPEVGKSFTPIAMLIPTKAFISSAVVGCQWGSDVAFVLSAVGWAGGL